VDAYRLEDALEAEALDFDRMISQGPVLIEWPERIHEILPEEHLWIILKYTAVEHRSMLLTPKGERFQVIIDKLRRKIYGDF
jgi:tRNA threonylcarbamoyladenosine biosynthesis protein TsaE